MLTAKPEYPLPTTGETGAVNRRKVKLSTSTLRHTLLIGVLQHRASFLQQCMVALNTGLVCGVGSPVQLECTYRVYLTLSLPGLSVHTENKYISTYVH